MWISVQLDVDEVWVPPSWAADLRKTLEQFTNLRTARLPKTFLCRWLYFGGSLWDHRPPNGTLVPEVFLTHALRTGEHGSF